MRFKTCLRAVALAGLWLFLDSSGQAFGCSCVETVGTPCRPSSGDVVFVGTLVEARDLEEAGGSGRQFVFRVEERFSGVDGPFVEVFSDKSTCGWNFTPGVPYLVDARKGSQGRISVDICSLTQPASQAPEEIGILRRIVARQPILGIFGQLIEFRRPGPQSLPTDPDLRQPLQNVPVEISGGTATHRTSTDGSGRFAVWDLPPGVYRVSVDLPPPFRLWTSPPGFRRLGTDPDRIELLTCPARLSLTASSWQ